MRKKELTSHYVRCRAQSEAADLELETMCWGETMSVYIRDVNGQKSDEKPIRTYESVTILKEDLEPVPAGSSTKFRGGARGPNLLRLLEI